MRQTLGIAIGVIVATAVFLALVIQPVRPQPEAPRRPVHKAAKPPDHKTPTPNPAASEKGVLNGRVLQKGKPFAGKATVEMVLSTDPKRKITATVAGGRFPLTGLEPGDWFASAAAGGLVSPTKVTKAGDAVATVDLSLVPGCRVRGTLTDGEGKPIEGASVVAREMIAGFGPAFPHEASPDKDGAYEYALLAPGKFELVASAPGYEPSRHEVELTEGKTLEGASSSFRLPRMRWGKIRGTVLGPDGKPATGARLRVTPTEGRVVKSPEADGTFEIEAPPGKVVVAADLAGYATAVVDDVEVPKGGEVACEVRLGAGPCSLEGHVLLGTGAPAAGAVVECLLGSGDPGAASAGIVASARTDAAGRFAIRGFAEGSEVQVRVTAEGFAAVDEGVTRVPEKGLEYVVGVVDYATLAGRVVTPAGTAPAAYEMKLWRIVEGETRSIVGTYTSGGPDSGHDPQFTAEQGSFTFRRLMPGTYVLAVKAPEGAPTELGPIQVPGGSELSGLAVRLGKGRSIAGRVVGRSSGRGFEGAEVTVLTPGGETAAETVKTAADGAFTVSNLGPGKYVLEVMHEPYRDVQQTVEVYADNDVVGLRITMDDSTALEGTVVDAEGKPVAAGRVVAMREGERREGELKDGAYSVHGLVGGTYTVWASSPGSGQVRLTGVAVAADGRTQVNLRLSPGGTLRITVASAKGGVAGARVSLRWKDGDEVQSPALVDSAGQACEWTGADGVVVVQNVPTEPLVLRLTKGGTSHEMAICVPEGATLQFKVSWPGE